MNVHTKLVKQLDRGFTFWGKANQEAPRPRIGWIKTIRKALGIKINQLAERLEVNPSRVIVIESSELKDALTLKTLREVAEALECEFVYALVPKKTLKTTLEDRAKSIIRNRIQRVSHSMALEEQSVPQDESMEQEIEELSQLLLSKPRLLNSIWEMSASEKRKYKGRIRRSIKPLKDKKGK